MTSVRLAVVVLAVAAMLAPIAAAQPSLAPSRSEPSLAPPSLTPRKEPARRRTRVATRWYGRETISADLVSFAVLSLAVATESRVLATFGGVGYVFAAPLAHAAHGNGGDAAVSAFLFRPTIALVTAAVAFDQCFESDCDDGDVMRYVLGGFVVAGLLDGAMAYETVRVAPMVGNGGRGLALTGTF